MSKQLFSLALATAFIALFSFSCAQKLKGEIAFKNETGETITEVVMSHGNAKEFDDNNLLKEPLAPGATFSLDKGVFTKAGAYDFDFYAEDSDASYDLWDVDVKAVNAVSVTKNDKYVEEAGDDSE
jgi:hypothetical protein